MCIKEVRETCIGFVQRQWKILIQGGGGRGAGGAIPQCLKTFLSNKGQYAKAAPAMTIFAVFATIWWMNLN